MAVTGGVLVTVDHVEHGAGRADQASEVGDGNRVGVYTAAASELCRYCAYPGVAAVEAP